MDDAERVISRPPVPERHRQHFPTNGGPRLSRRTRKIGRKGVAECRKALHEHEDSDTLELR